MEVFKYGNEKVNGNFKEIEMVRKVRCLVLNSKGHLLVTKNRGVFLLPGGTVEKGEKDVEALKREIKQETGITEVKLKLPNPLLQIQSFHTKQGINAKSKSVHKLNITDIYLGYTTQEVDRSKTELTDAEKNGNLQGFFENITRMLYFIENNPVSNVRKEEFNFEILKAIELLIKEQKKERRSQEKEK